MITVSERILVELQDEVLRQGREIADLRAKNYKFFKDNLALGNQISTLEGKLVKRDEACTRLHNMASADGTHLDFAIIRLRALDPASAEELEKRIKDGPSH